MTVAAIMDYIPLLNSWNKLISIFSSPIGKPCFKFVIELPNSSVKGVSVHFASLFWWSSLYYYENFQRDTKDLRLKRAIIYRTYNWFRFACQGAGIAWSEISRLSFVLPWTKAYRFLRPSGPIAPVRSAAPWLQLKPRGPTGPVILLMLLSL